MGEMEFWRWVAAIFLGSAIGRLAALNGWGGDPYFAIVGSLCVAATIWIVIYFVKRQNQ